MHALTNVNYKKPRVEKISFLNYKLNLVVLLGLEFSGLNPGFLFKAKLNGFMSFCMIFNLTEQVLLDDVLTK